MRKRRLSFFGLNILLLIEFNFCWSVQCWRINNENVCMATLVVDVVLCLFGLIMQFIGGLFCVEAMGMK